MSLLTDIDIEVSRRHVHLSRGVIDLLFGKGYELKPQRFLSTGSDFAAEETVNLVNGDRSIAGVRIVGPERGYDQVELSKSDAANLDMDPPVRLSGILEGTPGIKLVGPEGKINIESGVIISQRHFHIPESEAESMGINDSEIFELHVGEDNDFVFDNVVARVTPVGKIVVHLDSDDANAALISKIGKGILKK